MRAVVLQRDPALLRRITRLWKSSGLEVAGCSDPAEVEKHIEGATLLAADEFDRDLVIAMLAAHPKLRACVWIAEPIQRCLKLLKQEPRVMAVLGRPSFEAPPRDLELASIAWRAQHPERRIPLSGYLRFGASTFEVPVRDTAGVEAAVHRAESFVAGIEVTKWVSEVIAELVHELLMNAVYDAPADSRGRPRFAHDRKAKVELPPEEAAQLRVGSDGGFVVVQVSDPFGRLKRDHVVDGLVRGLQSGELDDTGGGAGLGMAVCHNSSVAMIYDLIPGKQTEVTSIFDLELNRREFRTTPRSLHFFEREETR
jgi:hypothetical protein